MTHVNCDSAKLKDLIVTTLSVADPCALDRLGRRIDFLWALHDKKSCGDSAMQYWMTRQSAIDYLRGCYAWQVDVATSNTRSQMAHDHSARQDAAMQAQSTAQSNRWADSVAQSKYDDVADSRTDAGSQRDRVSSSFADSFSTYRDRGSGGGETKFSNFAKSKGQSKGGSKSESKTETPREENVSIDSGLSYRCDRNQATGNYYVLSTVQVNESSFAFVQRDTKRHFAYTVSESCSASGNVAYNVGESGSGRKHGSSFQAKIDSESRGTSGSQMNDDSSSFRDAKSHADGRGTSQSGSTAKAEGSAQGDSITQGDGESHRNTVRTSATEADDIAYGQRFEHLTMLYENAREMVAHLRRMRAQGYGITLGFIAAMQPDGHCSTSACCALRS